MLGYIELKERCEAQMQLEVCNGCHACSLRCSVGVPATREEWQTLQAYLADASEEEQAHLLRVQQQEKAVDLGDGVSVRMCRYWDRTTEGCSVYPARPLVCRLLGHVEWMPCPIEKVPKVIPTQDALALMRSYAEFERHTFEEWEEVERKPKLEGVSNV